MVVRRRVHNQIHIQINFKNGVPKVSIVAHWFGQITYHHSISYRVAEFVLFTVAIILPISIHAGVFTTLVGVTAKPALAQASEVIKTSSSFDIPVLTAVQNPDPQSARGGGDIIAFDGALVSTGPVGADAIGAAKHSSGEISVYVVRPGDSLSQIAEMFGVTANTILWANDIPRGTSIQPGDTLVILPIIGVRHVVKSGDTIATIAKKYGANAEEIISYNQLVAATDIKVGDTLIIPGGEVQNSPVIKTAAPSPTKIAGTKRAASSGAKVGQVSKGCLGWLCNPVPNAIKTQSLHGYNAVDLGTPVGTPVHAAAAGTVIVSKSSGWNGGYGRYIVIRHPNGTQTLYAHLSQNNVVVGTVVGQGDVIAVSGNTGRSTGPHLHFEVRGGTNPF